jgi:predicted nucleic acid-binding protein
MAKSVVLDTNLLVLLVVGHTDKSLIERHKNLSTYDADGFDLLVETLAEYSQVVLTPNTLTEASNLVRQIGDPHRLRVTLMLGHLIQEHEERYIVSKDAAIEKTFGRLGLTDAALLVVARKQGSLLSADNNLYLAASTEGIEAFNFAHLYEARFG